jgi:hypothetical protein
MQIDNTVTSNLLKEQRLIDKEKTDYARFIFPGLFKEIQFPDKKDIHEWKSLANTIVSLSKYFVDNKIAIQIELDSDYYIENNKKLTITYL